MATSYRGSRDHLDDLVELARRIVERRGAELAPATDDDAARRLADREVGIAILAERIERRLAATAAAGPAVPLDRLCTTFALSSTERRVLGFLIALEIAPGTVGAAEARLGAHASLEALDALFYRDPEVRSRFADELATDGRLFRHALVEWADARGDDTSRFARTLRPVPRVIELAFGRTALAPDVAAVATLIERPAPAPLLVPDAALRTVREALRTHAERGDGPVPLVIGPPGAGRHAVVLTAARALDRAVLSVRCAELPADARLADTLAAIEREAMLHGALIELRGAEVLPADAEAGRRDRAHALDAVLAHCPAPLVITATAELTAPLVPSRGTIPVELGVPAEAERAILWARALPGAEPALTEALAARYTVTGGVIERAARTAHNRASGHDRAVEAADVHVGIRATVEDRLTKLGVRLDWRPRRDDLVLPEEQDAELRELVARVQHRRRVLDDWGFAAKLGKGLGLPVLFSGPPGTGKTMAAALVAGELGLDLYQIDLARMVSKYIGETEKNLAQVFDAAESGHAILLFDEADALFARRTEVKSSNDRYANLEVNFLLQRMERFTGITILTTNFESGIDEAFRRRLAFHVAFPMPEADERTRLWRAVMPARAATAPDVDFAALGARFAISGGYIRNAAVRAAYLAAAAGAPIDQRHLVAAALAECAAMGKVIHGGGR